MTAIDNTLPDKSKRLHELSIKYPQLERYERACECLVAITLTNYNTDELFKRLEAIMIEEMISNKETKTWK